MKHRISAVALIVFLLFGIVLVGETKKTFAATKLEMRETTMECSIWSAPSTEEKYRVKTVPAGYSVTVNVNVIPSITGGDKTFYKTIKGNYILCRCLTTQGIAVEVPEPTAEEIYAYYDRAVFVGDSIMLGFRNYATKTTSSYANKSDFLTVGSYSLSHAIRPVSQDSLQPLYQGSKRNVWDSIALMNVDRVFLLFGTNDIGLSYRPLDVVCEDYKTLIDKIREVNPKIEIHIISMTPVYEGVHSGNLSKDGIPEYNRMLKALASDNGYGYVNLYSALANSDGNLIPGYCSDEYVHHSKSAYSVPWNQVLYRYAMNALMDE